MNRRNFIKATATAACGLALTGCIKKEEKTVGPLFLSGHDSFRDRIDRDVELLPPLTIKEIAIRVGASKPFSVMHISDTHLTHVDSRDDERKITLAAGRARWMSHGEHYLDEAVRYARERGMVLMHTGDLYDFVSEANLDCAAEHMLMGDWFVCAGNHEYSKYVGEAREDEAYKADSRKAVQGAYPNDLTFASRIINGVNFVALDNVYYNFTEVQHARMEEEMKKGLPVVMLCHVPLYTPEICAEELRASDGECAYVVGAPLEITEKFDPGKSYPKGEEWRYRKVQQRSDKATLDFIAWLKEQPLLKGILCGHMHQVFEERFSPTAIQYVAGATFHGDVQVIHFK